VKLARLGITTTKMFYPPPSASGVDAKHPLIMAIRLNHSHKIFSWK
jgi:hypothetical protein